MPSGYRSGSSKHLSNCEEIIGGEIAGTIFSRTSLFYSLYAAVYDLAFGLGLEHAHPPRARVAEGTLSARQNLISLSESLESGEIPDQWRAFYEATRQSTDKLPQRQARHQLLIQTLAEAFSE